MKILKHTILSVSLLVLTACSSLSSSGNLDEFTQKYPQTKDEIAKLDPDFQSVLDLPLQYPFAIQDIEASTNQPDPHKLSTDLQLNVKPKNVSGMVIIRIQHAKEPHYGGDEEIKLDNGVIAKYSAKPAVNYLQWNDPQKELMYNISGTPNITKAQLVEVANQIVNR